MAATVNDPIVAEKLDLARKLIASNRQEEALALLDDLWVERDISSEAHLLRAQIQSQRGDFVGAVISAWRAEVLLQDSRLTAPIVKWCALSDETGRVARLTALAQHFAACGWKDFVRDRTNLEEFLFRWNAAQRIDERDVVLDVSAGECNDKPFFDHAPYVAFDFAIGNAAWDYSRIDIHGDVHAIPVPDCSVDVIVNFVSMEHYRDPFLAFREFSRILAPGGRIFLTAPMVYLEHQAPHDYFRYTRYGLEELVKQSGLELESIAPGCSMFRTIKWLLQDCLKVARNDFGLNSKEMDKVLDEILYPTLDTLDAYGKKFRPPSVAGIPANQLPILYRLIAHKPGPHKSLQRFPSRESLVEGLRTGRCVRHSN